MDKNENIVAKGKITHYEQFLFYHNVFKVIHDRCCKMCLHLGNGLTDFICLSFCMSNSCKAAWLIGITDLSVWPSVNDFIGVSFWQVNNSLLQALLVCVTVIDSYRNRQVNSFPLVCRHIYIWATPWENRW